MKIPKCESIRPADYNAMQITQKFRTFPMILMKQHVLSFHSYSWHKFCAGSVSLNIKKPKQKKTILIQSRNKKSMCGPYDVSENFLTYSRDIIWLSRVSNFTENHDLEIGFFKARVSCTHIKIATVLCPYYRTICLWLSQQHNSIFFILFWIVRHDWHTTTIYNWIKFTTCHPGKRRFKRPFALN